MNLQSSAAKNNKGFWIFVSFLLVGFVGVLDYLTGYELAFSPFYLIPVITASWFVGRSIGLLWAVLSALVWFSADFISGHSYSHPSFFVWNTVLRFVNFFIVSILISRLKSELSLQNQLAKTDHITGLANPRAFVEFLEMETARVARYRKPISVMYFDLDNFKMVNDRYGHSEGDRALFHIANTLKSSLRKTDFIARIGGDEFAVVLTGTGPDHAPIVCRKVRMILCAEMEKKGWPVTFSIGVVTVSGGSTIISPEAILHQADELMYQVKRGGKNNILCEPYQPVD